MALAVDLMGVGLPQEQATRLGASNLTTIAGATTAQGTATPIPAQTTNVLATTSSGQTALRLSADAELEQPYSVVNSTGTAALIFPPAGGTINAAAQDASVSIAQNLGRIFIRKSLTRWISFLTA